MEKSYTKEEVKNLIQPLMDQIDFYQRQYHNCQKYIMLPWYKRLNPYKFIRSLWKAEDESGTIVYQFLKYYQNHPEQFEFLKEWYDRKSIRNN